MFDRQKLVRFIGTVGFLGLVGLAFSQPASAHTRRITKAERRFWAQWRRDHPGAVTTVGSGGGGGHIAGGGGGGAVPVAGGGRVNPITGTGRSLVTSAPVSRAVATTQGSGGSTAQHLRDKAEDRFETLYKKYHGLEPSVYKARQAASGSSAITGSSVGSPAVSRAAAISRAATTRNMTFAPRPNAFARQPRARFGRGNFAAHRAFPRRSGGGGGRGRRR